MWGPFYTCDACGHADEGDLPWERPRPKLWEPPPDARLSLPRP